MKKSYVFISMMIMLMACCTNDIEDSVGMPTTTDNIGSTEKRSYEEAIEIAKNSISILEHHGVTRGVTAKRTVCVDEPAIAISSGYSLTRSGKSVNDTVLYVLNFNDDLGFAVVSASKNTEGLLAVTESGHFDPDGFSEIEGFNMFIESAKKYVKFSAPAVPKFDPITQRKDSTAYRESYVGPYVTVRWGQGYCYGAYCTNHLAGCSNTAMAQIMTYFEYPSSISLTYSGADRSFQTLDWDDMKSHVCSSPHYPCQASSDAHAAIGRLCKQLVTMTHSDDSSSSGTVTGKSNVSSALLSLGYQIGNWEDYSSASSTLYSRLSDGKVFLIRGDLENGSDGHMWVLDGTYTLTTEQFSWTKTEYDHDWILDLHTIHSTTYYHYNWGFNGSNNGYFNRNVFKVDDVLKPDTSNNTQTYNLSRNVQVLSVFHE